LFAELEKTVPTSFGFTIMPGDGFREVTSAAIAEVAGVSIDGLKESNSPE
jgi:hypothetical protein